MIYLFLFLLLSSCSSTRNIQEQRHNIQVDSVFYELNLLVKNRKVAEIHEETITHDSSISSNPVKEKKTRIIKVVDETDSQVKAEEVKTEKIENNKIEKKDTKVKGFDFGIIKTYLFFGALISIVAIALKYRKRGE